MFLLDTTAVSDLRRTGSPGHNTGLAAWAAAVPAHQMFISALTVQELETGVLLIERRDDVQGAVLRAWLEQRVMVAFSDRVLPIDVAVARRAAAMHVPDPRPFADALIAATAAVHGMTVVTRNTDDFQPLGVAHLNPWT
jgi:predicted nucleic acid-binding protein